MSESTVPIARTPPFRQGTIAATSRGATPPKPHAVLRLASHRLLPLSHGDVAVMATDSLGWCVMRQDAFDDMRRHLAVAAVTLESAADMTADLRSLWNSGLLLANGAPHPATVYLPGPTPQSLIIKMTGACNYACTYCYDYDVQRSHARVGVDRAMSVIAELLPKVAHLDVIFHGGEPLLRLKSIREIVDHVALSGWDSRVTYHIVTNGSLLDRTARDFLEEHDFSVGISCDGNTPEANALRVTRRAPSPDSVLSGLLDEAPEFVRQRCHILAVATQTSAPTIAEFAVWLQSQGIRELYTIFLYATGRGAGSGESDGLQPDQAVALLRSMVELIRAGAIAELNYTTLTGRMDRLFRLMPYRACPHGRCHAAGGGMSLDADGSLRTCEIHYHPFFHLGSATDPVPDGRLCPVRLAVVKRADDLRDGASACGECSLFGLCGGTCPALAIIEHDTPGAVSSMECAITRYLYPEVLQEFADGGDSMPILDYYRRHTGVETAPPRSSLAAPA